MSRMTKQEVIDLVDEVDLKKLNLSPKGEEKVREGLVELQEALENFGELLLEDPAGEA